jgi:hypothetical protein
MLQRPPGKAALSGKQGRGGNATQCAHCGAPLQPKLGSRRQRFCDDACRKSATRALKNGARYPYSGVSGSVQNNPIKSEACEGDFRGRGSGICGPEDVIAREIGGGRNWHEVVSPDGVVVTVTNWRRVQVR